MKSYLDTSSGEVVMALGELDDADATVTTDYATAKAIFVDQDSGGGHAGAFMAGEDHRAGRHDEADGDAGVDARRRG